MRSARPCGVCQSAEAAKYRCPSCAAAYCSVPCCRTHKEGCTPEPQRGQERAAAGQGLLGEPNRAGHLAGSPWSVEDILTEDDEQDRVPLQKLKLLGESEELQGLLLNPHLRQLLLTLDQAEDKSSLMKKYMQEPLFVEFADFCLRIVEPPEKENIIPE
ncbi:ZNHI3 protein, partial [Eubucco bourcierii]|nr:ZNHI3 protein [Eubucco bourcierii]